jgi:hydrogenase-4 component H
MLKTIKEILRTGDATTQYPAAPLHQYDHYRGKPEHNLENCIACAACAVACPPNAIQMKIDPKGGTTTWSINFGRCIFCGRCEEVCPTKAIVLTKEFELAVFDKNDLEQTATYPLQACSVCGKYYAPAKEVDYASRIIAQSAGESGGGDDDAQLALKYIGMCPDCRREADAKRAKARVDAMGDPTPDPTEEQLEEARRIAAENRLKSIHDMYGGGER